MSTLYNKPQTLSEKEFWEMKTALSIDPSVRFMPKISFYEENTDLINPTLVAIPILVLLFAIRDFISSAENYLLIILLIIPQMYVFAVGVRLIIFIIPRIINYYKRKNSLTLYYNKLKHDVVSSIDYSEFLRRY